jgi:hypothetical protein
MDALGSHLNGIIASDQATVVSNGSSFTFTNLNGQGTITAILAKGLATVNVTTSTFTLESAAAAFNSERIGELSLSYFCSRH